MDGWRDKSVWLRLDAEGAAKAGAGAGVGGDAEAGSPSGLVAAAAAIDPADPAAVARLRRRFDADLVAAALELALGRRKAAGRFEGAERLWCDAQGVEQASGTLVARWKATRIRERLGAGAAILDVCSGIGGDAIELARAGLAVRAIDLDPRRAWMTARNAGCHAEVGDAEAIDPAGLVIHADPARRDERGGARSWSLDDHRPGRAWIERVLREARGAAVKFAPGVDRAAFGAIPIEWEFIEVDGQLVQAVAWAGVLAAAPGSTRATRLGRAVAAATIAGRPDDARADRVGVVEGSIATDSWICEPRAALERARLLTEAVEATPGATAAELVRGLGLLASDRPLDPAWFESFRIVGPCAARADAIAALLAAHGLRPRSVRVRGAAVDADRLTRALGCTPAGDAVVFAYREGQRATVMVARVG
jgi:hypothetical protein